MSQLFLKAWTRHEISLSKNKKDSNPHHSTFFVAEKVVSPWPDADNGLETIYTERKLTMLTAKLADVRVSSHLHEIKVFPYSM